MTGGALDIQKLIPVDGEGDYVGDGAVHIQFISALGVKQIAYGYYGDDEYDDGMKAGWVDEDNDELATYSFNSAEAFLVSSSTACNFQYSGEVNMAETDVPFRKNLSVQANIRPSTVDLQDIIPVDGEGDYIGDGAVHIQFITALGVKQTAYGYYGDDEYDDGMKAGWVDEDNDELIDLTLSAGEGFMVTASQAGYLRFPEM